VLATLNPGAGRSKATAQAKGQHGVLRDHDCAQSGDVSHWCADFVRYYMRDRNLRRVLGFQWHLGPRLLVKP
jgi:hypothetical protein